MTEYWTKGLVALVGVAAVGCSANGGFPGVSRGDDGGDPMDTVCSLPDECIVFARGAAAGVVELGSLCGPLGICTATEVSKAYDGDPATCSEASITLDALGLALGDAVTYRFDTGSVAPSGISFAGVELLVNLSTLELGAVEDITLTTLLNGAVAEGPVSFADLTTSFGNGYVDVGLGGATENGTEAPVVAGFFTTTAYDQIELAFNSGVADLDPADFTAQVCDVITGIEDLSAQ